MEATHHGLISDYSSLWYYNVPSRAGLHISEDVTRRAKDSRTELRKFTRELKLSDPEAVINMEYDNLKVDSRLLKVNGKRYTWSDAIHAVIDTQDNTV